MSKQEESVRYFAYFSNLNESQLRGERDVYWNNKFVAILEGWRFAFNKRVANPNYLGYSAANIVPEVGSIVEGVVYELVSGDELVKLNKFEVGYDQTPVEVRCPDGSSVRAITYVARQEWIEEGLTPHPNYFERGITGGEEVFSPQYKAHIYKAAGKKF